MAEAAQIRVPVERLAPDTIRLERLLDAPPEKVWRYLTEARLREQWFMGGTDARAGAEFDLIVDHDKLSTDDAPYPESYAGAKGKTFHETVIRFEPPELLETTFQGGKNGTVTYELFAERGGTRLVLTHRGIVSPTGFQDFGSGWTSHLAVLGEKLAGRSVKNFWELHAQSREAVKRALG
jgi:uncharacterized protein YndB with AHSA1/START domain